MRNAINHKECTHYGGYKDECVQCLNNAQKGVCFTCGTKSKASVACRICGSTNCPFCYDYEAIACESCVKKRRENEPKKERM